MQKAAISARSGRRSGGCYASLKRAKADAKSDDQGGRGCVALRVRVAGVASPAGSGWQGLRRPPGQGGRVAGVASPAGSGWQGLRRPPGQGKALRLIETVSASALP